jgi:phosphate-selective porin OprO and OprP
MNRNTRNFSLLMLAMVVFGNAMGQMSNAALPYFTYNKGLGITTPDSSFSVNFRFRMQNRVAFKTVSENDFAIDDVEARVRRLRLRFDGFVYSPRLTYTLQLSFSRGDMDYEAMGFPNVVRDAYIQYAITDKFSIGFGQTKLPGNRQRVNSSGDLQFVDRSMVNATFNIDRDFGLQAHYKAEKFVAKAAISSGEGRNISNSNSGLSYTGRVEFLPFGKFTNGGDFYEGDLAREKTPKLSIGIAYNHNEDAMRTGGQLGSLLYDYTDISTQFVDVLYKYNGWAFAAEFMKRNSPTPITTEESTGSQRYVYVGEGQNYQGSYLFKNNYEIAARYSVVTPGEEIEGMQNKKEQYTLGATKYLKGHRVKLQSNVTLESTDLIVTTEKCWIVAFQIELGI